MTQEMMDLQVQIDQIKERLNTLRAECAPEEVKNYVFVDHEVYAVNVVLV